MVNATGAALPIGWGTTVGTTPQLAIPANPSRQALIFVNASTGINIAFCPAQVAVGTLGVYTPIATGVPVINGPGSVTMAPGDKFIIDTLNVTTAFNCVASGAGGVLTMFES